MKNNKGFTVVELLASFSLTMVIIVFLFEILLEIKDLYYEAGVKTEVLQRQALLVSKIRNILDTNELSGVDCSGDTCTLKFTDNDSIALTIDADTSTIIFGENKYEFPEEIRFGSYGIKTCEVDANGPTNSLGEALGSNINNCYFDLSITVTSPTLEKDYPINIVYPYIYNNSFINGNFVPESDKTGSSTWYGCEEAVKEYTALESGTYKIELLGASGGASTDGKIKGGKGAYTSGEIYLNKDEKLYFYVGCAGSKVEEGETVSNSGGYNGGGDGSTGTAGSGGGGATDVRIGTDLNTRIMVAAGGSGAGNGDNAKAGMPGGGLIAANSASIKGATQTTGNAFGIGGNSAEQLGSGGGGGYYGGAGGTADGSPGTGGSSFISGHFGSDARNSSGTHTGQSIHYSNKVFYNTEIYSGDKVPADKTAESFANSKGFENVGDGYAVITYESSYAPSEALKVSGSSATYPTGMTLWLDGYDNAGSGLHSYDTNIWRNLRDNTNLTLISPKWTKDGLDLKTTGSITMNVTKGFTVSTALTLNKYPTEKAYLIKGAAGIYVNSDGKIGFDDNAGRSVSFEYSLKPNLKNYLTIAVTGTDVILYVNGEKKETKTLSTVVHDSTTLTLPGTLDGTLHKVMIYSSALDAESIKAIYSEDTERFSSNEKINDNLKLEYNFYDNNYAINDPDSDGKLVSDTSGNENYAKIVGTNNYDTENRGFILDGSANYIEIPGDINYRYTISLIVSGTDISGTPSLLGNSTYPELYLNADNKYTFKAQGIDTPFAQTFQTNKKEYITLTYDGNNIDLYVDGSKKGTLAMTVDPVSVSSAFIGKTFKGNLYKYAVYDRVLLDEEIIALYEYDYSSFK